MMSLVFQASANHPVHRHLLRRVLPLCIGLCAVNGVTLSGQETVAASDPEVVDIGDRRELFLDHLLVETMDRLSFAMHRPVKVPRSLHNRPFGHYATVIKDGDRYRLYYRGDKIAGMHWRDGWGRYHENEVTEYAESSDGYHWTEPDLGLHEFEGIPEGNVLLDGLDHFLVTHNFSPFLDLRPGVPAAERYKALGGGRYPPENWGGWKEDDERADLQERHGVGGLRAYVSPDGVHWKRLQDEPVIPEAFGNFDSQNVVFWSEAEAQYVCYYRFFRNGLRAVRRTTSSDFVHWKDPEDIAANEPGEHLYTTGTHPYFRAPHIYVALATRFMIKRSAITDIVLMSTRPGAAQFERLFKDAYIRPGLGPAGWGNRSNYITCNVVPTSETEMSLYMYGGDHYTLRTDGFVSIHAGSETGTLLTRPLRFSGSKLDLNLSTSAAGAVRVEVQDAESGLPLPGLSLDDCEPLFGDAISRTVRWGEAGNELSAHQGKPVRLRFEMIEADLYSLRFFTPPSED